jgi:hypothetical protein
MTICFRLPSAMYRLVFFLMMLALPRVSPAQFTFAEAAENGFSMMELLFKEALQHADQWDEFNETAMKVAEEAMYTVEGAVERSPYIRAVDVLFDFRGTFRKIHHAGGEYGFDGVLIQASAEVFRISFLPWAGLAGLSAGNVIGTFIAGPMLAFGNPAAVITPYLVSALGGVAGVWLMRGAFDEWGMNEETLRFLAEEAASFRTLFLRLGLGHYEKAKDLAISTAVHLDVEVAAGRMETVRIIKETVEKITEIVKIPGSTPPVTSGTTGPLCGSAVDAGGRLVETLDKAWAEKDLTVARSLADQAAQEARIAADLARDCRCGAARDAFLQAEARAGEAAQVNRLDALRATVLAARDLAAKGRGHAQDCR